MNTKAILNVEMDRFSRSFECLATTGVGPCLCFVVILDRGDQGRRNDFWVGGAQVTLSICGGAQSTFL